MGWLVMVFRVLTACTALMMMLSPSVVIYRVLKTRSTGVASIYPMVATLFNTHAWMMWGYMAENYFPIFSTYVVGEIALLVFISVFYKFSRERAYAHQVFLVFGALMAIDTVYVVLGGVGVTNQTRHQVSNFSGYIGIVAALAMYTSPFEKLRLVLKHHSGVFIPIHMTFAGCLNNATFMSYCYLTDTWILFVPNTFFLCMGLVQATLYFVYHPSTHPYTPAPEDTGNSTFEGDIDTNKDLEVSTSRAGEGKRSGDAAAAFVALRSPLVPLQEATIDQ